MVRVPGPVLLGRFVTLEPLRGLWNDQFFKSFAIIVSIFALTFLCVTTIVSSNGTANCEKNYGKGYRYDMNASDANASKKCVNKKTGERKPIVVEKSQ